MEIREPILGVAFEPSSASSTANDKRVHESRRAVASANVGKIAIVWGASWVAKVDLEVVQRAFEKFGNEGKTETPKGKKRSRETNGNGKEEEKGLKLDFKVTRRYQPICYLGFVGTGEMCVVERTWFDLVSPFECFASKREWKLMNVNGCRRRICRMLGVGMESTELKKREVQLQRRFSIHSKSLFFRYRCCSVPLLR